MGKLDKELILLIETLNYKKESDDIYSYCFEDFNSKITVDLKNEKIEYPEKIKVNERQTCNFSALENFVVLECVHRLLKKGYAPSSIELEKRWSLGHGKKSGRADICVYDTDDSSMCLIIECKTFGTEYEKAKAQLKQDGGQLFSYWCKL